MTRSDAIIFSTGAASCLVIGTGIIWAIDGIPQWVGVLADPNFWRAIGLCVGVIVFLCGLVFAFVGLIEWLFPTRHDRSKTQD